MIAQKGLFLILLATILIIISICALSLPRYVEIYAINHEETLPDFDSSNKSTINPEVPISNVNKEPELTNENSRMEIVVGANGKPKKYLNAHYYAEYLKILREQHNLMFHDIIHKADLAVANTNVYSVTLKPQLAPSNDPHDY
ncbi:15143_t:CDS:1, partial [Dentiscutata erythropus]